MRQKVMVGISVVLVFGMLLTSFSNNTTVSYILKTSTSHGAIGAIGFSLLSVCWAIVQVIYVRSVVRSVNAGSSPLIVATLARIGFALQLGGMVVAAYGFHSALGVYERLVSPSQILLSEYFVVTMAHSRIFVTLGFAFVVLGEFAKAPTWIMFHLPKGSKARTGFWLRGVTYFLLSITFLAFAYLSLFAISAYLQVVPLESKLAVGPVEIDDLSKMFGAFHSMVITYYCALICSIAIFFCLITSLFSRSLETRNNEKI